VELCREMQSCVGQCGVVQGNVELCTAIWSCVGQCIVV
jgi:hypothetical protein